MGQAGVRTLADDIDIPWWTREDILLNGFGGDMYVSNFLGHVIIEDERDVQTIVG